MFYADDQSCCDTTRWLVIFCCQVEVSYDDCRARLKSKKIKVLMSVAIQ